MKTKRPTTKLMIGLLACFTMLARTALGQQAVPHQQVPPRTVNTNGATILGDDSAVPPSPVGPATPPLSPAPTSDFQGLTDNNVLFPPDTHGAVGTNFVVTMLNTQPCPDPHGYHRPDDDAAAVLDQHQHRNLFDRLRPAHRLRSIQ